MIDEGGRLLIGGVNNVECQIITLVIHRGRPGHIRDPVIYDVGRVAGNAG